MSQDLVTRTLVAIIGIVLILVLMTMTSWGMTFLAFGGALLSLFEFFVMLFPITRSKFQFWTSIGGGSLIVFLIVFRSHFLYEGISLFFLCFFIFYLLLAHVREENASKLFSELAFTFIGIFYIGFLFSFWSKVRGLDEGVYWIFLVFLIPWLSDTAGYLIGRTFGKNKLSWISPHKTIEGSMAGIAASLLGVMGYKVFIFYSLTILDCFMIGILGAILSQLGDLFESFIKRALNVKDSGVIIPGHGGILDRFDSVLFCGPFIYFYAKFFA